MFRAMLRSASADQLVETIGNLATRVRDGDSEALEDYVVAVRVAQERGWFVDPLGWVQ